MKPLFALCLMFALASSSHGGLIGWLTSEARDWQFIQRTGGIRVGAPRVVDGKRVLPVEYDASGLTTITCKPTTINSGLAVRRIEAFRKDGIIVLRVRTQVIEKKSASGLVHFADLSAIPPGTYEVFYGSPDDKETRLGKISIE